MALSGMAETAPTRLHAAEAPTATTERVVFDCHCIATSPHIPEGLSRQSSYRASDQTGCVAEQSNSANGGAPTPAIEWAPCGVFSMMRADALRSPTAKVTVRV